MKRLALQCCYILGVLHSQGLFAVRLDRIYLHSSKCAYNILTIIEIPTFGGQIWLGFFPRVVYIGTQLQEEWCYKMIGKIREAGSRRRIIWTESGIDTRPLHASGPHHATRQCLLLRGAEAELKPWPLWKSEREGACYQIHLPPDSLPSHPSIL